MLNRAHFASMVALALAGSQSAPYESQPSGLFGFVRNPKLYGTKSAGISMAQQKRASIKKRNQRRHKAAGRRK